MSADPVFALIEEHRTAWAAYVATMPGAGTNPDDPTFAALNHADEALDRLMAMPPQSLAGLGAVITYLADYGPHHGDPSMVYPALPALAEACRNLIGGAA